MNILITGGVGYLGKRLTFKYTDGGHKVLSIVREGTSAERIAAVRNIAEVVYANDPELESKLLDFSPTAVIHTACVYEKAGRTSEEILEGNLIFPLKILRFTMQSGTKLWINAATSLPDSFNMYSLSKSQFSQWGKFFADNEGLTFLNLQLEHFYGRDVPDSLFVGWLTKGLIDGGPLYLTEGTQKKDFIYVEDVERVFCELLIKPLSGYHNIPVGTGYAPSLREVIEYLHEITHSKSQLNFGAIPMRANEPNSDCDTSIIKQLGIASPCIWKMGMKKVWGDDR